MPSQFRIRDTNPHFNVYRKHGKFPSNLTFGFEDEITYSQGDYAKLDNKIKEFMLKNPYLYMKEEMSNNGVEINSHPFTWNYFTDLMKSSGRFTFISELSALTTP